MHVGARAYPNWSRPANWISVSELARCYGPRSKAELDASADVHAVTGRVVKIRESSRKLWFLDIVQDGARSQLILSRNSYQDQAAFEACTRLLARGDIIEAKGAVTRTLTGELSLRVSQMEVLAPCQQHLPDGEFDTENRMRFRHLDMLSDHGFIQTLKTRASIVRTIRSYLEDNGFTEVETPVLASGYGGANARPFETRHLDSFPLYMRIAPELSLKQLVVGGLERVYELGKVFRNEGLDADHNPEFTSCEFYQAYANCEDMMEHTENLLSTIARSLGSELFENRPFQRIDIVGGLEERLQARLPLDEPDPSAREKLLRIAQEQQIGSVNETQRLPKIYDKLIEHFLEPLCKEPTFLTGHPMVLSPLAKARKNSPHVADRFELYAGGFEIANGFSEQNDPGVQLAAFQKQVRDRANGDLEAQPLDDNFVDVLRMGLPPTGGCGIGVDRITMLFTGKTHIRDVLAFPLLKPRSQTGTAE